MLPSLTEYERRTLIYINLPRNTQLPQDIFEQIPNLQQIIIGREILRRPIDFITLSYLEVGKIKKNRKKDRTTSATSPTDKTTTSPIAEERQKNMDQQVTKAQKDITLPVMTMTTQRTISRSPPITSHQPISRLAPITKAMVTVNTSGGADLSDMTTCVVSTSMDVIISKLQGMLHQAANYSWVTDNEALLILPSKNASSMDIINKMETFFDIVNNKVQNATVIARNSQMSAQKAINRMVASSEAPTRTGIWKWVGITAVIILGSSIILLAFKGTIWLGNKICNCFKAGDRSGTEVTLVNITSIEDGVAATSDQLTAQAAVESRSDDYYEPDSYSSFEEEEALYHNTVSVAINHSIPNINPDVLENNVNKPSPTLPRASIARSPPPPRPKPPIIQPSILPRVTNASAVTKTAPPIPVKPLLTLTSNVKAHRPHRSSSCDGLKTFRRRRSEGEGDYSSLEGGEDETAQLNAASTHKCDVTVSTPPHELCSNLALEDAAHDQAIVCEIPSPTSEDIDAIETTDL